MWIAASLAVPKLDLSRLPNAQNRDCPAKLRNGNSYKSNTKTLTVMGSKFAGFLLERDLEHGIRDVQLAKCNPQHARIPRSTDWSVSVSGGRGCCP